ncbi:MAG: DUF721 domain-containing protein [Bacteroidales bacterium]|nr:DUF721 domain-containing protein [Bacteroidales bacterium]
MASDNVKTGFRRHEAVGMDELVDQFIRDMKLASGLNRQRVREAWNAVSGSSRYTLDVSLDKDVMTCVISSSVVRNQLYFQRELLVEKLNLYLETDQMFVRERNDVPIVNKLILK